MDQIRVLPADIESVDLRIGTVEEGGVRIDDWEKSEYPEILAKLEHYRWYNERRAQGWRYGPVRDNEKKLNPFLIPWEHPKKKTKANKHLFTTPVMSEEDKKKDMFIFEKLPEILEEAGFALYKRSDGFRNTYESKGAANAPIIFSFAGHMDITQDSAKKLKESVRALFRKFHTRFPYTDLVLMCGMARGADTIVIETALENHVRVSPVIACNRADYRKSLPDDADRERFDKLYDLCTKDPIGGLQPYEIPAEDGPDYHSCTAYMLAHSHMLIVAWDGCEYYPKIGGTFDAVRMACTGLDFDLFEYRRNNYLDNIEDLPIYWIPIKRTGGESNRVSDKQLIERPEGNDEPCYISSMINADNVGKCTLDKYYSERKKKKLSESDNRVVRSFATLGEGFNNSLKGFKKRIKKLRDKKVPPMKVRDDYNIGKILNKCHSHYLPDVYYQIFTDMDNFNKEAGTQYDDYQDTDGENVPEERKNEKIHRCRTDEDSILDGIYSMGAKPGYESWKNNRSGLNNIIYDMDDNLMTELKENPSDGRYERVQNVRKTLNNIRYHKYGDATALRFDLAFRLSEINETVNKKMHKMLIASIVLNYCMFGIFMMSSGALLAMIIYILSFIGGNVLLWLHHNNEEHRKMVEYRCLAESLRTRYYLSLLNIEGDLSLSYYDHIRNRTGWIRAALISWDLHCFDDPKVQYTEEMSAPDVCDAIHQAWVVNGLYHHKDKERRNGRLYDKNKVMATFAVGGIMTMAILQIIACLKIIRFNLFEVNEIALFDVTLITALSFSALVTFKTMMILFSTAQKYTSQTKKRIIGGNSDEIYAKVKLFTLADIRIREQSKAWDYYTPKNSDRLLYDYGKKRIPKELMDIIPEGLQDREKVDRISEGMHALIITEKREIFKELGEQCIKENSEWVFSNKSKDVKMLTTKEV